MVLFKVPREDLSQEQDEERGSSYWVLTELARREQFLFKGRDINFFQLEDVNCMKRYGGADKTTEDALVLFSRELNEAGQWKQNRALLNREDIRHM